MIVRFLSTALVAAMLVACGDTQPVATDTGTSANAEPKRERARPAKVGCDVHYALVREVILGILRGSEKGSLIAHATRNSTAVLSELEPGKSRLDYDCSFENRRLVEKRAPTGAAPFAMPESCSALIERIDARCLKPLAERGEALDQECNVMLVSLANMGDGPQGKLGNSGLCASFARGF